MDKLKAIEKEQIRENPLTLNIGDTVKVHVKVKEGNRERIQVFEGTIIKKQRGGANETFTVRRVAYGTGVERTFPVNSPKVEKVEIVRPGTVRRAKLYYLRDRVGKATRVKEDISARSVKEEE
jgi:large subunit ribosomal protein L19